MPCKNVLKTYAEGCFYHIYNRGVNKNPIFLDEEDYAVFLYLFKKYLDPEFEEKKFNPNTGEPHFIKPNSSSKDLALLGFTLMPNHFHLITENLTRNGIEKLMRRHSTSYVKYFNEKYHRVGPLFQGTYKAVLVRSEKQLVRLSVYTHLNPTEISKEIADNLESYEYSSYPYYIGKKKAKWLHPETILGMFGKEGDIKSSRNSYKKLVERSIPHFLDLKHSLESAVIE